MKKNKQLIQLEPWRTEQNEMNIFDINIDKVLSPSTLKQKQLSRNIMMSAKAPNKSRLFDEQKKAKSLRNINHSNNPVTTFRLADGGLTFQQIIPYFKVQEKRQKTVPTFKTEIQKINSSKNMIQVKTFDVNEHLHVKQPTPRKRKLYKKSQINKYSEPVQRSYCIQQKPINKLQESKIQKIPSMHHSPQRIFYLNDKWTLNLQKKTALFSKQIRNIQKLKLNDKLFY